MIKDIIMRGINRAPSSFAKYIALEMPSARYFCNTRLAGF